MQFVLIHGGFHVGSSWNGVRWWLETRGHSVLTPTLLGHGIDVPTDVSHRDVVDAVVNEIEEHDLRDVVLVGHSYGGSVVAPVATRIPERLNRLVFVDALVPVDGKPVLELDFPDFWGFFKSGEPEGKIECPYGIWREQFMNDADEGTARATYQQLVPQPTRPILDVVDCPGFAELDTPRSYIKMLEDFVLPHQGDWLRLADRLGLYRLVQMHGGHEVMYSDPSGLAAKIVEASRP